MHMPVRGRCSANRDQIRLSAADFVDQMNPAIC